MDAEKINQALYEKMSAEQEELRSWLLTQTPEEILTYAYAYAMREDILEAMKKVNLSEKEAAVLLENTDLMGPLGAVCKAFREADLHVDIAREFIEEHAAKELESVQMFTRSIPLYQQSGEYAREHGELDAFRASRKANVACRDAIEAAIQAGYDGMHLNADAKGVLAEFGPERVSYVLAATLRGKTWDERFSRDNQAWAAAIPMAEPQDRRSAYVINSHSLLLNGFVSMVRKELDTTREQRPQAAKRPSIKEQLTAKPVSGDQPAKPKDKGAR